MNRLLERQIERLLPRAERIPDSLEPLLCAVSDAYDGFDLDRRLIERSLDISSEELTAINQRLRQEISDRKDAEEELRQTVSLLAATLESTTDGILVVDRQGQVKDYNTHFQTLWRIPDEIIASKADSNLLAFVLDQLEAPDAFLAKVRELYSEPTAESFDVLRFKDGRVFERYSKPQLVGDEIAGRVWSFRDITDRVEASRQQNRLLAELEEANAEFERANKELENFAYIVSHDLKAPLRGIKTLADWICQDYKDALDDQGKEHLSLLLSRADRMHNLIDGILRYSRGGRIVDEIGPVDTNEIVRDVIDLLAPPENITIVARPCLPVVQAERTKIVQVFQNLLSNAIKYMDKPQGRIEVNAVKEGKVWKFSVSDNGPGIEEKYFDKVFQIFQTLSPRDEYDSTGVGLSLVKRIVEAYGGDIWLESEIGNGCAFSFTLPEVSSPKGAPNAKLQTSPAC